MISKNVVRVVDALKSGDFDELKQAIYRLKEYIFEDSRALLSDQQSNGKFEENFYYALSILLNSREFDHFKHLLDFSDIG